MPDNPSAAEIAAIAEKFIDVVPRAMWSIRYGMRSAAGTEFTVPQFRVMAALWRGPKTNGELAELIGTSVPAMSRMVDGLVNDGIVVRRPQELDRRQIILELNGVGRKKFLRMRKLTQKAFARKFSEFDSEKLRALMAGLGMLEELFP